MGPFHTRFPMYNVVHVKALLQQLAPQAVALATLAPGALSKPDWQATNEIALPHTVVPWLARRGLPTFEVGAPAGSDGAPGHRGDAESFQRYLSEYESGKQRLRRVQSALQPVQHLLQGALDLGRVITELLPAIAEYHSVRAAEYGEGPGTDWQQERADVVCSRVLALPYERVALLAGVDDVGPLVAALSEHAEAVLPQHPLALAQADQEAARTRALLDVAMRGDAHDPAGLLNELRKMDLPEARYHEANVLLANGHAAEALQLLTAVSATDFQEPYYLPGFVLARLGQLQDLAQDRTAAMRAYRGVLALSYAPPEAVEAAMSGLEEPFDPEVERAVE